MSILEMALSVDNPNPAVSSSSCRNLVDQESVVKAAVKLQKVYRSYRTRRRLADDAIADDAVVAEEFWWQLLDYARLNHSTVSFFNFYKPENAATRWCRVSSNASKVGKGLCEDAKAKKLAFQHWIEAIDPRHRYGHNLNFYYEEWHKSEAGQPFFYWLDIGDGREVDLKECPRLRLREQSIKYLGPLEREHYEYIIEDGAMVHKQTGNLLDTKQELQGSNKWIFVMSSSKRLYAGEKKKGKFHHSSFLAGGTTLAAGSLTAEKGKLKSVSAYSGHYRPTDENLGNFIAFLEENGVNLDQVQVLPPTEDYEKGDISKSIQNGNRFCQSTSPGATKLQDYSNIQKKQTSDSSICAQDQIASSYKSLAKEKEVLGRSKFRKEASSYLLGHQLRNG